MNKTFRLTAMAMMVGSALVAVPTAAHAQQEKMITLDLKDSPIRDTLEMVFKQANINNYVIDNNVAGFVTLTITDQPFDAALKLIMRAASVPLTYTKENNVWIVKPRVVNPAPATTTDTAPESDVTPVNTPTFERINLTYINPLSLRDSGLLGQVLYFRFFPQSLMSGGMGGGMMGGMGGGMMGGMGGMGGGMMGGMGGMGGGMMGGMGGMGGGMMGGGMGGMGGGMMGGGMGGMGGGMMGGGMGGMGGGFGGGRGF